MQGSGEAWRRGTAKRFNLNSPGFQSRVGGLIQIKIFPFQIRNVQVFFPGFIRYGKDGMKINVIDVFNTGIFQASVIDGHFHRFFKALFFINLFIKKGRMHYNGLFELQ